MFFRNLPLPTSTGGGGGGGPFLADNGSAAAPAYSFSSDSATGMYLIASGQLGFSTSGTLRFTINGSTSITSTLPFYGPAGSATAPAFSFSGDPNTGMYDVGADQLGFTTGGTLRLTVDGSTSITSTLPFYGAAGSNTAPTFTFSGDPNTGSYNVGADQWGVTTGGTLRLTVNGSTSITSTLPFYAPSGTVSAPGYAFSAEVDCGLYVIGTNNIGMALNGAVTMNMAPSAWSLTQAVATSGSPVAWTIVGGAHTTLAASTEARDVFFNLARTVQFATGALTNQRAVYIGAPTYAFVAASTITNAATVYIEGDPVAGTNATLTNKFGLVNAGKSQFQDSVFAQNGITITTGKSLDFTSAGSLIRETAGGSPAFQLAAGTNVSWDLQSGLSAASTRTDILLTVSATRNQIAKSMLLQSGSVERWSIDGGGSQTNTQVAMDGAAGTVRAALTIVGGAHTTLAASTEYSSVLFNFGQTIQFATGALTNERTVRILAATYAFVGASTITNAATFYIDGPPVAGTNATLTNTYSMWIDSGHIRLDSAVAMDGGEGSATLGTMPTGGAEAQNEWIRIDTQNGLRWVPCWAPA